MTAALAEEPRWSNTSDSYFLFVSLTGVKTSEAGSILIKNSLFGVCLHLFMAHCGSVNEGHAHAHSSTMTEIYKTEPCIRTAL